jgi:L-rhamnose-H+ transport protein
MTLFFTLLLVLLAGLINGSFALPTKYMDKWREETIWLNFSFWGFLILPWLSILLISPNALQIFFAIPSHLFWVMLLGGFCFGIGQICFAFALRILGLGVAFVINIGLGTAGSTLLPLLFWHQDKLLTSYGFTIFIGVLLFTFGILMGTLAGKACKLTQTKKSKVPKKNTLLLLGGLILGILAGIGSICQALTYVYVNPFISALATHDYNASFFTAYNIAWVGIFTGAFIPYMFYFLILNIKNKSLPDMIKPETGKYWSFTFIMGFFFWMSLVFFSKASQILGGNLAPIIAWPLFMIFIILTSNFWGWRAKEWQGCGTKTARKMWISIAALIIAVFVFAYANNLKLPIEQSTQHVVPKT